MPAPVASTNAIRAASNGELSLAATPAATAAMVMSSIRTWSRCCAPPGQSGTCSRAIGAARAAGLSWSAIGTFVEATGEVAAQCCASKVA